MRLSNSQRQLLEKEVQAAEQNLTPADSYLRGRGISPDAAKSARLGVVPTDQSGPSARFAGRLLIPYLTKTGVVSAKYRCIADHSCKDHGHGKYLGIEGMDALLYNTVDLFTPSHTIAITEGEIDALVLSKLVGIPAVGVPGVGSWKPWHPRCFNSQFAKVLIFADSDDAGRDFALRLIKGDSKARTAPLEGATVVHLEPGNDVNSTFCLEGADGILRRAGLTEDASE